jgi:uncharacterized protein
LDRFETAISDGLSKIASRLLVNQRKEPTMSSLSLILGTIVGFSLGLTGGGGAIFAVPLLVYGVALDPRQAVGVSLITVAGTALVGFVQRMRAGQIEFPIGLLFAVAGMLTTPFGVWLSRQLPEALLLVTFGLLMLVIAARMWLSAQRPEPAAVCVPVADNAGPVCRRDPQGELKLTSRCALLLAAVGLGAGVLAGLFGVGGGFIIVPALVTFGGMGMQRAIGTSLLIIMLISAMGIATQFASGGTVPTFVTLSFLLGSVAGLFAGTALSRRIAGPLLQQVFAAAIVVVGVFVIIRNIWS